MQCEIYNLTLDSGLTVVLYQHAVITPYDWHSVYSLIQLGVA